MAKFVTIGVAGHTDHGKTSLVQCMTGVYADRKESEKKRSLSIESSVAPLDWTADIKTAFIDIPGHKNFLKNAIRGLCAVDMVIMVIAADDGIMPQTLEHLEILKYLNIEHGIIVLSKADLVDPELLELAELEIRDLVEDTLFSDKPIIPFSAVDGKGKEKILACIEKEAEKIPGKNPDSPFRMWIDQIKGFPGIGTVACGTILSGRVSQDELLHLVPPINETKARSLEVHHQKVTRAAAGHRVGINLPKISLKEISRGMALVKRDTANLYRFLNVEITMTRSLKDRQRVKLYLGTSVSNIMVVLMDKERLKSGETGLAQLRLQKPLPARPQDTFIICSLNIQTVMGGGIILETSKIKYRKAKAAMIIPYLKAVQNNDLEKIIAYFLKNNSNRFITKKELSEYTGLPFPVIEEKFKAMIENGKIIVFKGEKFYLKKQYHEITAKILKVVENDLSQNPLKEALNKEEIRKQIRPFLDNSLLQTMLTDLCSRKKLAKYAGCFTIPDFTTQLTEFQEKTAELLLNHARKLGFLTFSAGSFCKNRKGNFKKDEVQKILEYLNHQGKLIRLNNNNFLSSDVIDDIKIRVKTAIVEKGSINLTNSKEILGYGRAKAAPVFEYLDEIGFTIRQGNERLLRN